MRMSKILGLLIPVLAEHACDPQYAQCEEESLVQLNGFQKSKVTDEGIPWWVWKKILEDNHPATTTTAPAAMFPCRDAEPQSPRNLSESFVGLEPPRVKPVGIKDEFPNLIHVNTHFHLGAEHLNVDEGGYSLDPPADVMPPDVRPGYFCAPVDEVAPAPFTLEPFEFEACQNVTVGYTYEFHWVFSTAGPKSGVLSGGLGGVFARDLNPSVVVRGQVCRIVNDPTNSQPYLSFNETWREPITNAMLYIGSTTSDAYDNDEQCSPFEVTWWVDRECCILSAQNMDRMCRDLLDFGINMEPDVKPASSRQIVAPFISDTNATIIRDTATTTGIPAGEIQ